MSIENKEFKIMIRYNQISHKARSIYQNPEK